MKYRVYMTDIYEVEAASESEAELMVWDDPTFKGEPIDMEIRAEEVPPLKLVRRKS